MNENEMKIVEKIASKYKEKETSKIDELKKLDKKAKKGSLIFACVFGSIGALLLGCGMSLILEQLIENYMLIGLIFGLVGLVIVSVNYFIYKVLLKKGKTKYSEQITKLSNELLNAN